METNSQSQGSKKSNRLVVIGLSVVIFILIGTTLLLLLQNLQLKNELSNEPDPPQGYPIVTPVSSPTPTQKPDKKAENWKLYTNTQHGFSFKYPAKYDFEVSLSENKEKVSINLGSTIDDSLSVIATKDYLAGDVLFFLDNESSGQKTLNGNTWAVFILNEGYQDAGNTRETPIFALRLEENNTLYTIVLLNQVNLSTKQEQILSTFEFLDSENLICGGLENKKCPDGYTCVLIDPLPGAKGTCALIRPGG